MLKEKLILRNMLNQVYNLPEMKLSSVYFFFKKHHVWHVSCDMRSTSIEWRVCLQCGDWGKSKILSHWEKAALNSLLYCMVFPPKMVPADHNRKGQRDIVLIVLIVFTCLGEQICHPKMYLVGMWIMLIFKCILLKYSWFTMLFGFLLYGKVILL